MGRNAIPENFFWIENFSKCCICTALKSISYDFLNMQEFLSRSKEIGQVIDRVRRMLLRELKNSYPDVDYFDDTDLVESLQDIYAATKQSFIIIIDEWDCVFREYQQDKKAQEEYLDFLRDFLKDKVYVALAYLTGILPIKNMEPILH